MADRVALQQLLGGAAELLLAVDKAEVEKAFQVDGGPDGDKVVERFFDPQASLPVVFFFNQHEGTWVLGAEARAVNCTASPGLAVVKVDPSAPLNIKQKDLRLQVHLHHLPEGSVFDCFATLVTSLFEPKMSAEVEQDSRTRREKATVMHSMEELLSNLSDQTTMVIPDVKLDKHIHEFILQKVASFKEVTPAEIASKIQGEKSGAGHWDGEFITQCYRLLSQGTKDIKNVVEMEARRKTSVLANAREEIKFWNDLSDALGEIQKQLGHKGWHVQIDILRRSGKVFLSGVSALETECGLRDCANNVKEYLHFLHDFPVGKLHQAKSIEAMSKAVTEIYDHMKKHLKSTKYPILRAMNLIDAVTRDFNRQLLKILSPQGLLDLDFDDFERETRGCETLFSDWTTQYRRFNEEWKKQARRAQPSSRNIPGGVQMGHLPLKQRVEHVLNYRKGHHKFVQVLKEVMPSGQEATDLGSGSTDALAEMHKAYEGVKNTVNDRLLDVTDDGQALWERAHRNYEQRVDKVEENITVKLKERLTRAETATEMFRVFSKFNPLTSTRPKIRSAIQSYQGHLITKVKEDMESLQEKFTAKYDHSEARHMARVRDVPKVSGNIIWARSIERQLQTLMKRVEDVYGRGWDRLKSLRKKGDGGAQGPSGYWQLDDQLAEFVGMKVDRLEKKARDALSSCWSSKTSSDQPATGKEKEQELRIIGTAIALAFLEVIFDDCKSDWQVLHDEGKESLKKMEKAYQVEEGYDQIRTMLKDVGVATQHTEGLALRKQGESFRGKINEAIQKHIKQWNEQMNRCIHQDWEIFAFTDKEGDEGGAGRSKRRVDVQGPIFKIDKGEQGDELVVNFHQGIVLLIKEVRAMGWLNLMRNVEFEIAETAIAAKDVYPHAMSLIDATRQFQKDIRSADRARHLLLQNETAATYKQIGVGLRLRWENELELNKVTKYIRTLHQHVARYHQRLEEVNKKVSEVEECLEKLEKCEPGPEEFKGSTLAIQKVLDSLSLSKFANLKEWTEGIDERITGILTARLTEILQGWTQQFKRLGDQEESSPGHVGDDDDDDDEKKKKGKKKKTKFQLSPVMVNIKIHNRVMVLDPHSLDYARKEWTTRLQKVMAWILTVPKLDAERFDDVERVGDTHYSEVLTKVSEAVIYEAFACVDLRCEEAFKYYEEWTKLQALWEMELDLIFDLCGEDLNKWLTLLHDIRNSKTMMDSSETRKDFGAIIVDYKSVQDKVAMKYDETSSKLMQKFSSIVGHDMRTFHDEVNKERQELEMMDFAADTKNMSRFLTRLPGIRKRHPKWKGEIELLDKSERELRRAKFKFPQEWFYYERAKSEWDAFNQALEQRNADVAKRKDELQRFVVDMAKDIEEEFQQLKKDWQNKRPTGPEKHTEAIDTIARFQEKSQDLKDQFREVCEAKEALDMEVRDLGKMDALSEDIASLREVWDKLAAVYDEIAKLGDTMWKDVNPRKVMQQLREIQGRLQQFPTSNRTYAAFDHLQKNVDAYLESNKIITELRSEALKERHWHELQKTLKDADGFDNLKTLTLGKVWATDLQRYAASFQAVIRQAQGEMALEEFLAQVKKCWNDMELEIVDYQKKCSLIKGWDVISEKLSEHLNSLQSMRMSPYFKQFEAEGTSWEDKLCKIQALFGMPDGVWFDVQRRWVYLEGIFFGNQDIKRQLPNESALFEGVDKEFTKLMAKVKKNAYVIQAFQIEGVADKLGHQARTLTAIQKALGDYLEKQRREFPRFYFVGDDDLLEIMGHSKDPEAVQKHFKKMFAGISNLQIDTDDPEAANPRPPIIKGMESSETEVVPFTEIIDLKQKSAVNVWMAAVVSSMQEVLRHGTCGAYKDFTAVAKSIDEKAFTDMVDKYPTQVVELAGILEWTRMVEESLRGLKAGSGGLQEVHKKCVDLLSKLAEMVLFAGEKPIRRKRIEILISALVYQRDATSRLMDQKLAGDKDFDWLVFMRFYLRKNDAGKEVVFAEIADACLPYSYEYLGVGDRLVQTPLTDKCYLTLTQALHTKMGGAPAGPAGTGKTETTKALGSKIARFVLVFCCDEAFDFKSMGRIFVGLCQVGAWGCFDEFNRLEERILSAVSQQIQVVQEGLAAGSKEIKLLDRDVPLHSDVGIFITMNPGYAGRSPLPDNLKQLFRPVAMSAPDREIIAEVMLFSCGFQQAKELSRKVVPLFQLCKDQLSQQGHYDFGLRALKGTLVNAGNMKREEYGTAKLTPEQELVIALKSIVKTVEPKLVAEDIGLFRTLCSDVFPGVALDEAGVEDLIRHIRDICVERSLLCEEQWLQKVLQVFSIQRIHHGLMLVGPSCSGKTMAWSTLLIAMSRLSGKEGVAYVIDPKAVNKAELYGSMDPTTREWTDGIFTATLRKIVDNQAGDDKTHWIIFDGDVDPEWVENLNSLLDDNKLLTLPNGERLQLPLNVKVIFEVQDLKYATAATVSRCGMVWFSADVCNTNMALHYYIDTLTRKHVENTFSVPLQSTARYEATVPKGRKKTADGEEGGDDEGGSPAAPVFGGGNQQQEMEWQLQYVKHLKPFFTQGGFVQQVVDVAVEILSQRTIMEWCTAQYLTSLYNIVNQGMLNMFEYNSGKPDFPLEDDVLSKYVTRRLILSLVWGMAGGCNFDSRMIFCERLGEICRKCGLSGHLPSGAILEYDVTINDGEWVLWSESVPVVDIPPHKVGTNDVIINTIDTVRHEEVVLAWLQSHRPMIFCGPPGSGKTMTLTGVLRRLTEYEPIFLNFSSGSLPDMIHKTFDHPSFQHTQISGVPVIRPNTPGKWIVIFCDECNLPATDKYGTQRIVALIRQIVERGGFYKTQQTGELIWVTVQRVQFAGACNPPTDPGRVPMTHRFLRYAPLLYVDYPARQSLEAIYGTFCRAFLRPLPPIKDQGDALARAMVDFYLASQKHFTPEMQSHYVYSPRELSRWTRAVYEGLNSLDFAGKQSLTVDELVRLSVHEGLRLFRDRLLLDEEKEWTDVEIDSSFNKSFPQLDREKALNRPILYSTMLTKEYGDNGIDDIRKHIQGKLKVFAEEEMDVQLVVFDSVVEHILRIDRIIRQPLGHMLLVGVAGAGKTVLSKFVSWHSGMTIFQIKAHRNYTILDFEEDLRQVLKRSGTKGERICFIFDESNVMDSGFLEYMNALLASGEVPGLFEGQEYEALMSSARDGINSLPGAKTVDTSDRNAMYKWFVQQVQINLHVIFTMNPNSPDFHSRCQTSPALFNRCTIDWFGEWSDEALLQVAEEYTETVDVFSSQDKDKPMFDSPQEAQSALSHSIVGFHHHVNGVNDKLRRKGAGRGTFITPRHYLDFIQQFKVLYKEKLGDVQEQQMHLSHGLSKLEDTADQVSQLRSELAVKEKDLAEVQKQAAAAMEQLKEDQKHAGQEQERAEKMEIALKVETEQIEKRQAEAEESFAKAKPALEAAKSAVSSIPAEGLREIRQYANPPAAVEKVMKMVMLMLGHKKSDWRSIKEVMGKESFLRDLINLKSEKITASAADEANTILADPKFDGASVARASKAAGPLYDWCSAQVMYGKIRHQIKPLMTEIAMLNKTAAQKEEDLKNTQQKLEELNASVKKIEQDFQERTQQKVQLEVQMKDIKTKFDRANNLLSSLDGERVRWGEEKQSFSKQITTVVGDTLLGGGFLAYNGYFDDHHRRSVILPRWMRALNDRKLNFKKHLALNEYLSHPQQRLEWQGHGLPLDELYVENAVILSRYQRYPLIIDPSGTAVSFLMSLHKDKNIAKTSFLEDGFMKSLETALRFGYPLLVQDVECIDPILNPILNREVSKQGGRTLVRLGEQSIDLSPAFKLFLSTRDSSFQFAPDISGRVTFANFTVTPGSLMNQCLQRTLEVERPEVQQQRGELMKAQGEYKLRQRVLEQELLNEISKAEGNILENDALIKQLKVIKETTADIKEKLDKTDDTMREIKKVEKQFRNIADAASKIYFMLVQLIDLNPLYTTSLGHFMQALDDVLHDGDSLPPVGEETKNARREIIMRNLFLQVYERHARAMMQRDHMTFALRLCQVRLGLRKGQDDGEEAGPSTDVPKDLWEFLLATGQTRNVRQPRNVPDGLESKQRAMLGDLITLPGMEKVSGDLDSNPQAWQHLVTSNNPIQDIPASVRESTGPQDNKVAQALRELIVLKVFRPDALKEQAARFASEVFDGLTASIQTPKPQRPFLDVGVPNLGALSDGGGPYAPLLLCSAPGFDASDRVQGFASQKGKKLVEIAMGSPEGYSEADQAFYTGMNSGSWVLLKNVHLAPQYLSGLEKKLHAKQLEGKGDKSFRIFLTSEISPKIPANLLRRSHMLVFEPSNGLKPNLLRAVDKHRARQVQRKQDMKSLPIELPRLHFLAAWLHGVIMERLRYTPLGWTKAYEISEGHFRRTVDTIDAWVKKVADGRQQVPPQSLPWRALFVLLGESVYGGGIDNDFDGLLLKSFLTQFFNSEAFNPGFCLTGAYEGQKPLDIPKESSQEAFDEWVRKLPESQTPVWLGLPGLSQKMIQTQQGQAMLIDLVKIQDMFEEGEDDDDEMEAPSPPGSPGNWQKKQKNKAPEAETKEGTYIPEWARKLKDTVEGWLSELVEISYKKLAPLQGDAQSPITQALKREVSVSEKLYKMVKGDLKDVVAVCTGDAKPTNVVRDLMNQLGKEVIPARWKKYTVPPAMTVSPWISDFAMRCQKLNEFGKVDPDAYYDHEVNLGLLLYPGAFITATRQAVARRLKYPLERLVLSVDITKGAEGNGNTDDGGSFLILGLGLQSMALNNGRLGVLRDKLRSTLGTHRLWWRKQEAHSVPKDSLLLPLYLNYARTELLAQLQLPIDTRVPPYEWYQMGAAVTAWTEP
eukprot:Hpha_TRINITY_DN16720_c2_g6::TRINITY_DN16720_c2_g6_i1::g.79659::m.79659/K10413/DYNC1H; dynein heavy chain 1, cytosolic